MLTFLLSVLWRAADGQETSPFFCSFHFQKGGQVQGHLSCVSGSVMSITLPFCPRAGCAEFATCGVWPVWCVQTRSSHSSSLTQCARAAAVMAGLEESVSCAASLPAPVPSQQAKHPVCVSYLVLLFADHVS